VLEILGFADDARIAHAHELVAHLDRDVLQRALDHGAGDRIDPRRRLLLAVGAVNVVHRASPAILSMIGDGGAGSAPIVLACSGCVSPLVVVACRSGLIKLRLSLARAPHHPRLESRRQQ
jgi:hypothetical protein